MARRDPPCVTPRVKLCVHTKRTVAPFFFLARVPFFAPFMNTEWGVAILMY